MNRWLVAGCAVVAFAVTWFQLQHDAPARDATPPVAAPETAAISDWLGPEPTAAPGRVPDATVDEFVLVLDADLGDEGEPVDRQSIERALQTDPELRTALGLP